MYHDRGEVRIRGLTEIRIRSWKTVTCLEVTGKSCFIFFPYSYIRLFDSDTYKKLCTPGRTFVRFFAAEKMLEFLNFEGGTFQTIELSSYFIPLDLRY